LKKQD